jgi:hypothetical protein
VSEELDMTALPRELRARCEAVIKKLSDPKIAGAEGRIVRVEAQRIIDEIEALKAKRAVLNNSHCMQDAVAGSSAEQPTISR